jgi:hypothetical protein
VIFYWWPAPVSSRVFPRAETACSLLLRLTLARHTAGRG